MTTLNRTAYPLLSARASADELRARFSLGDEDTAFIYGSAKGPAQRSMLALLLVTRRWLGYFPALDDIPANLIDFMHQQLASSATALVHKQSLYRYQRRIRIYLGTRSYAPEGRGQVEAAVLKAARTMSDPADLINVAIEALSKANIELPAFSTLDRLVGYLRTRVHDTLYQETAATLTGPQKTVLDGLLKVAPDEQVSGFVQLKQAPGPPSLKYTRLWANRLESMDALLRSHLHPHLSGLTHTKVRQFGAEAMALSLNDMRGIRNRDKRHMLLLCVLHGAQCRARDELIEMFLRRMRRTQNAALDRMKALQASHRELEEGLLGLLGQVLGKADEDKSDAALGRDPRLAFEANGGLTHLEAHHLQVSAYHHNNYLPLLWPIHANARAVIFQLLGLLQLHSTTRDVRLLDALSLVTEHRHARKPILPLDIDIGFASQRWQQFICIRGDDGGVELDRRRLEVAVLMCLADALRSGDVYVEGSQDYADYREQLLPWSDCKSRLDEYCRAVGLPAQDDTLVEQLRRELADTAQRVDQDFPANSHLSIDPQGGAHLRKLNATAAPPGQETFERAIRARLPEHHLLDILKNTHSWSQYTRHFGPPSGADPKLPDATRRYLLTVFGYGCNLGSLQTARHAPSIANRHTLDRINAQHITATKLEAAGADIIAEYARFDIPKFWGEGRAAIADGTHMELRENNLLGQRHIRYGGYGAIAYHHIADNYIALFSNFIACGVWEAVYILDGLLQNRSVVQPDTLHADTHGQSEPVFALAWLLGIKLFPRMRTWNDVAFYRPNNQVRYQHLDSLFTETVDWELIRRHWPDMMQVALSIQAGTVLPSMLLRKLGVHSRKNRLYRAFRELGRVIRTLFLLRYVSDVPLRRTIRRETTKVESYNDFLDWIAFGGPALKSGDPVEQGKRVKYMNVVANAIMLHNVVDLTDTVNAMVVEGATVTAEMVAGLSPYMREHIRRFGRYDLEMDAVPAPLEPFPLQLSPM